MDKIVIIILIVFVGVLIAILLPIVFADSTFFDNPNDVFIMGSNPVATSSASGSGGISTSDNSNMPIANNNIQNTGFSFLEILTIVIAIFLLLAYIFRDKD